MLKISDLNKQAIYAPSNSNFAKKHAQVPSLPRVATTPLIASEEWLKGGMYRVPQEN